MNPRTEKDISVIITTANRPKDLTNALASVAKQTAISRILEVVVIENGGCSNSAEVCTAYWQLPIRHILNMPPRPVSQYLTTTFIESTPRGAYVALLHDDDYWLPDHLEHSVDALALHPSAASSYTMPLVHRNDGTTGTYGGFFPWLVAGHQWTSQYVILEEHQALLATLFYTSFHYSTLVARKEVVSRAVSSYDAHNPFDTDRVLASLLATQGLTIYHPTPRVWIQQHASQDSAAKLNTKAARDWWDDTTNRIVSLLNALGASPSELLQRFTDERQVQTSAVLRNQNYRTAAEVIQRGNSTLKQFKELKQLNRKHLWELLTPPIAPLLLRRVARLFESLRR